ncbi:MAG: hypothetical protein JO329_23385 [Planctomycetaceae bacterium]|nr:hypothetical protein [Planctomycetaceae bacterium]
MWKRLGSRNVRARGGHGFDGWPGHAPDDAVMPTAAPGKLAQPLRDQFRSGHRGQDIQGVVPQRASNLAACRRLPRAGAGTGRRSGRMRR